MLKKRDRLTKKQFDHFFKVGKRHHSPHLQLIFSPYESFHGAAVAGKKVYKRAVDRNKIRRQLYSVLYQERKRHDLKNIYIVIAKPSAKDTDYQILKQEVVDLVGLTTKSR